MRASRLNRPRNRQSTALNRFTTAEEQCLGDETDHHKGEDMHPHATRAVRCLAVLLALAALAAPSAGAGRFGPGTPSRAGEQRTVHMPRQTCHQYCASVDQYLSQARPGHPALTQVQPRIVTVTTDTGFNWADAAVGFGAASGLALLALGTTLVRRHGRVRHARQSV
jgi:hypothetical protein